MLGSKIILAILVTFIANCSLAADAIHTEQSRPDNFVDVKQAISQIQVDMLNNLFTIFSSFIF